MEKEIVINERIPAKEKVCYGIGGFMDGGGVSLMSCIMLKYMTTMGVAMAVASTIMTVAKLWDAVTDPLMGFISDNTRSKWGRRKPYMFIGGVGVILTLLIMFMPVREWGMSIGGFTSMRALHVGDDPTRASIPFDAQRSGFVLGEGAGILMLEEYEHAMARGAKVYAEVVGYGATCDAYHMTAPAPNGEGGARAMAQALADGGVAPEQVGYINAHGTSTPLNDSGETTAIKTVFGDHAYKMAVSSTKSMTGHMLGAAGAVEAIFSALTLKDGFLPATIHYQVPDPACDLDYVPNQGRETQVEYVLSNSLGFGGHNACVLFKKWEG